tara:strand:+ start:740 stop:973 length:234 start_codon:yes stop_codon:yes gene_type:complete
MLKKIFLFIIILYQRLVSPYLPQSCRFQPTCSEYAKEAIEKYGIIKGVTLASKRLTKCHPIKFLGGSEGYDPVPKKE